MEKIFTRKLFFPVFLVAFLVSVSHLDAQTICRGEASEQLWQTNVTKWAKNFVQTVHSNKKDFHLFIRYNQEEFLKDKGNFFILAQQGKMDESNAMQYFAQLKKKYVPLYSQFLYVKSNYPTTLSQYTAIHRNNSYTGQALTAGCNVACYNLNCSNGTLDGWNAYYATNQSTTSSRATSALVGGPCGPVTQAAQDPNTGNDYQVKIMTGNGVDPVCGAFIPVVPPSGNYSIRIGDSTASGLGVAEATNSFVVPATNPLLTIQYAVVLENPPSHLGWTQPWFEMKVVDSLGNPISACGQYSVVSTSNLPGFKAYYWPAGGDTAFCKSWTTVYVPLRAYIGHCVTAIFEASDCAYGAHFGYAYINCSCTSPGIIASSPSFCGQNIITLTAPPGAASYLWTGPCITGSNSQQTCSITCPGTYQVIVTSTAGPTCDDTLSITIGASAGPPPVPDFTSDTVCAGTPTQFTNFSNPLNGPGVKFYWDFYNNNHFEDSTHTNPLWTFPQGGVYLVHLHEVNNGCGMDTTIRVIVDSTHVPIMSAFGSCTGSPAYFSNLSGSGHYIWNFGDPNCPPSQDTSSLTWTTHTYTQPGTYTVTLSDSNTHCPASATQIITISSSPTETISFSANCGSPIVTFHADDSTNIFEFYWMFQGANGSPTFGSWFSVSSATASFTFPSANSSYQVVLTAYSSPNFCPGTDTLRFTLGYDTARFSIRPSQACLGRPVIFKDSSSGFPSKWRWDFGDPASAPDDSSSLKNPTHQFSGPGTYTVKLVVTSASGCSDSTTQNVTLNPVAVANFTGDSVCFGDSTDFIDMSTIIGGNISGWSWNFGDPPSGPNNTSTLQNPAHKYSAPGTYTVSLTAQTLAGCDSTITKTVLVYAAPVPKFTATKTCIGATTQFTDQSTVSSGTITTWAWNFGDGGTDNTQNPAHTYITTGWFNVKLVVTSSNGCVDSVTEKIMVNPIPVVSFTADTLSGCSPLCVNFTDHSTISSGNDVKWQWNLGAPADSSSAQNPHFCYTSAGVYNVQLTVTSDSGCTITQTVNSMITVYGHPTASITANPMVVDLFSPVVTYTAGNSADSIIKYLWLFSGDSTATGKIATHTYTDTGIFCTELEVFDKHGCGDSTNICVEVSALYTFYIPSAFTPANINGLNEIFRAYGTYVNQYDMYIFDRWGQMLFHSNNMNIGWNGTVNNVICQEDTYVYQFNIVDSYGKRHSYIGRVSLLK
jgi:gliding motility-associated-like protein